MSGLTYRQAGDLDRAGWKRDVLLVLNQRMKEHCVSGQPLTHESWAFMVEHESKLLIYRSFALADVEAAFMPVKPIDLLTPVIAYCDGSGMKKDTTAGIGTVIFAPGARPRYIAENIGLGTNNVAELRAIWRVLQAIPNASQAIDIHTDSEYAIGSLTKPWNATANKELIADIKADLAARPEDRVRFIHTRGHVGIEAQEIADRLANIGRTLISTVSL